MPKVSLPNKAKDYVSVYEYHCSCCGKKEQSITHVVKLMCCGYYMDHIEEEKFGQLDIFDVTGVSVPPVKPSPVLKIPTFNFFKGRGIKVEQLDLFDVTGVTVNG
jgi:hypothetical protein